MKPIQVLKEAYSGFKRNLSRPSSKPIQVLKKPYPGFKRSLSRF